MKIVMVDYFLPGSIYSLELCDKLAKSHEVVMICKDNYQVERDFPFRILPILHSKSRNPLHAFYQYLMDLKKIYRTITVTDADVVHLQGVQHVFWESLLLHLLKNKNRKLVYTAHNILSHEAKVGEKGKLCKWYRNFDRIIVHNEMSKKMLLEASDYCGKVCVVPFGSYDTYCMSHEEKTWNSERVVFLQFGMVRGYKGVDILLDAIALIPTEIRKKTRFVIAGVLNKVYYDFNLADRVEQLGIEECVELQLRRIEDDDIPKLFNACDFCLFPYRHIYGSGALLMAYTFEKPVIVSDIPVFVEETENGKTGLIFESENAQALADAICACVRMTKEQRAKYTNAIREAVRTKYNWTRSAELTAEAYE